MRSLVSHSVGVANTTTCNFNGGYVLGQLEGKHFFVSQSTNGWNFASDAVSLVAWSVRKFTILRGHLTISRGIHVALYTVMAFFANRPLAYIL